MNPGIAHRAVYRSEPNPKGRRHLAMRRTVFGARTSHVLGFTRGRASMNRMDVVFDAQTRKSHLVMSRNDANCHVRRRNHDRRDASRVHGNVVLHHVPSQHNRHTEIAARSNINHSWFINFS
jgi:hypothetical protein